MPRAVAVVRSKKVGKVLTLTPAVRFALAAYTYPAQLRPLLRAVRGERQKACTGRTECMDFGDREQVSNVAGPTARRIAGHTKIQRIVRTLRELVRRALRRNSRGPAGGPS